MARNNAVRDHPIISLKVLFLLGQLIFSQIISFGYGASSISIFSASCPKYFIKIYLSSSSNCYMKLSLISSVDIIITAFSHITLSSLISSISLLCYYSILIAISSIFLSSSFSLAFCSQFYSFFSHFCFSLMRCLFSSRQLQNYSS